jgi:hypothetical protein
MNNTRVFKSEEGKIIGFTTDPNAGELISTNSIEYQEWLQQQTKDLEENRIKSSWDWLRQQRNNLLKESDWTVLPDAPVKNKEAWLTYRQALRDITEGLTDPMDAVWPTKPE